jgi:hypothetical protein
MARRVVRNRGLIVLGVALVVVSVVAQLSLSNAINRAEAIQSLDAASARIGPLADAANEAHRNVAAARADLLTALDRRRFVVLPAANRRALRTAIGRLLDGAERVAEATPPDKRAVTGINRASHEAHQAVTRLLMGRGEAEDVIRLAVDNFAGAEAERATARFNLYDAQKTYDRACRDSGLDGCVNESIG